MSLHVRRRSPNTRHSASGRVAAIASMTSARLNSGTVGIWVSVTWSALSVSDVVTEDDFGDARRLARTFDLEDELLGHLRATGDVFHRQESDAQAQLRADRHRRREPHLAAA